jgi:hypothetical protein
MTSQGTPHSGIHLFLGSDRPAKLNRIKSISSALKINLLDKHDFLASALHPKELGLLLRQAPYSSTIRLIVIDEANKLDSRCVKILQEARGAALKNSCVILLIDSKLPDSSPLAALASGVIVERFGEELTLSKNKGSKTSGDFSLVEAIGRRDALSALQTAKEQMLEGKEPLELLGLIGWQLQRWLLVANLKEEGLGNPKIAESTGLSIWQVERISDELSGRKSLWLNKLLKRCLELDIMAKSGKILPNLALEEMIVSLCCQQKVLKREAQAG